jgi:tetratricopeptide (TPR) repeat protein
VHIIDANMEMLLSSTVVYANLEEVARLQRCGDGLEQTAALVAHAIASVSAQLLESVLDELTHPEVEGCVPDAARAAAAKAAGAAAFADRRFEDAARQYSAALRFLDETRSAALAARLYCNRALCAANLGDHRRALADATCAADADAAFAKAHYRCALASQALGDLDAAMHSAERAVELQREQGAGGAEAAALLAGLARQRRRAGKAAPPAQSAWTTHDVPQELRDCPAAAPPGDAPPRGCADDEAAELARQSSPLLTVLRSAAAGRQLAAAEAVAAGVDLFREAPFAHALSKRHRLTVRLASPSA